MLDGGDFYGEDEVDTCEACDKAAKDLHHASKIYAPSTPRKKKMWGEKFSNIDYGIQGSFR